VKEMDAKQKQMPKKTLFLTGKSTSVAKIYTLLFLVVVFVKHYLWILSI